MDLALRGPHIELMIFGWVMQFAMGIAFWILPRLGGEQRFGRTGVGWFCFGALNGGLILGGSGAWFDHDAVALAGRLLVLGALVAFAVVVLPRVKPLGGAAVSLSVVNRPASGDQS